MNAAGYSPIAPLFRVCDGVRIRFADNKAHSSAATVLMLSPWPESLWAFRGIWDRVSGAARVVAIDLPGFGHSDGRPELIAPDAMGTFLARLIEEWGLGAPHVVGPDVGTAAALFLAANAPDRVTSLTIGGGAVRAPIDAGGALKDVIEAPSLDVVRQLDARTNIGFAVEPAAGADSEPDVHEDYVSAYDLGRFAESARFVRHYPEQNPVLRGLLPTITTPAQIIAGREDDLVPWSNNEYLADLLPNSEIRPLDAGHFAWEQASDEYGRLIVEWVTGGFQRLGGAVAAVTAMLLRPTTRVARAGPAATSAVARPPARPARAPRRAPRVRARRRRAPPCSAPSTRRRAPPGSSAALTASRAAFAVAVACEPGYAPGRRWTSDTTGANRSPCSATRARTAPASKTSACGSPDAAHAATSSQVTGAETVGRSRARSE